MPDSMVTKVSINTAIALFSRASPLGVQLPISHILIINWYGKIGDAVISSTLFRELRRSKEELRISVITTEELETLYGDHYGADEVFVVKKNFGLFELNRISRRVKRVDTVLPLVGILDFKHLFLLSRLKPRNVFSFDKDPELSNIRMFEICAGMVMHDVFLEILGLMQVKVIDDSYIIPSGSSRARDGFDIVFNPFGSREDKSLSCEKAVLLLNRLGRQFPDRRIGLLSSPSTLPQARSIAESVFPENVEVVDGIISFYDAMDVIVASRTVISVDTCFVHIAAGLNKPLIAIYYRAGDEFNRWLPRKSPRTRVIFCEGPANYVLKDMNNFDESEIIQELDSLLQGE